MASKLHTLVTLFVLSAVAEGIYIEFDNAIYDTPSVPVGLYPIGTVPPGLSVLAHDLCLTGGWVGIYTCYFYSQSAEEWSCDKTLVRETCGSDSDPNACCFLSRQTSYQMEAKVFLDLYPSDQAIPMVINGRIAIGEDLPISSSLSSSVSSSLSSVSSSTSSSISGSSFVSVPSSDSLSSSLPPPSTSDSTPLSSQISSVSSRSTSTPGSTSDSTSLRSDSLRSISSASESAEKSSIRSTSSFSDSTSASAEESSIRSTESTEPTSLSGGWSGMWSGMSSESEEESELWESSSDRWNPPSEVESASSTGLRGRYLWFIPLFA